MPTLPTSQSRRRPETVTHRRHTPKNRRPLSAPLALAALSALTVIGVSTPAAATASDSATVTVSSDLGEATASTDEATVVQLEGSGFQSVDGGFGGIYVMFGWVSGDTWAPSQGGTSGVDYFFVPDVQTADNAGYMKFVAFPGSSTGSEANGGTLEADGTWATDLVIPGPVVTLEDVSGNEREIDCREETCGVITFGAHGVVNANNETFTPVTFVEPGAVAEDEATSPEEPTAEETATEESTTGDVQESTPPAPEQSEAPSEPADDAATADATGDEQTADESGDGSATPWIIAGIAVVVLGGVAVAFLVRRGGGGSGDAGDEDSDA